MARINIIFFVAFFGLLHLVSSQFLGGQSGLDVIRNLTTDITAAVPQNLPTGPSVQADVTATVMALLNETGYTGKASDANVQEIVVMLMNGIVPSDADLVRLNIIPQKASPQLTTPPSYSIPGNPAGLDLSMSFPMTASGTQTGPFVGNQAVASAVPQTGAPDVPQTLASALPQTGVSTSSTFVGTALANILSSGGASVAAPKSVLGDPFNLNSITATVEPLHDPNAVGPKPFQSASPVGGLGTPGAPTDLLSSLGIGGAGVGMSSVPQPLQTGILETTINQQRHSGNAMQNPMMMMFMMNPEMMEGMMAENPMMAYFMMQQFTKPRHKPQPAPTLSTNLPLEMGAFAGLGGSTGTGGMSASPLSGPSATGVSTGGLMDLMNSLGTMGGGSSATTGTGGMSPSPLAGQPAMGPNTGTLMDLMNSMGTMAGGSSATPGMASLTASPGGTPQGMTDMSAFLNMVNMGSAGAAPSASLGTDPFAAAVG